MIQGDDSGEMVEGREGGKGMDGYGDHGEAVREGR